MLAKYQLRPGANVLSFLCKQCRKTVSCHQTTTPKATLCNNEPRPVEQCGVWDAGAFACGVLIQSLCGQAADLQLIHAEIVSLGTISLHGKEKTPDTG